MPEYTDHTCWLVTLDASVIVEASNQDQAIERARDLFIEGEGTLSFNAVLREVKIAEPEV